MEGGGGTFFKVVVIGILEYLVLSATQTYINTASTNIFLFKISHKIIN